MASIYGGNTIKNEMMSLLKKGEIFEQLNNNYKNTKNCKYICKHEFNNTICRHKNMNKCTFAHSIRDLDDIFKEKILSLGIEAYHYLYHIEKEQYSNRYNNNISLIQYIEQLKTSSNHYSNKLKELDLEKKRINNELSDIKHYNKLLVKKKNIFNFETNLSKVSISSLLKQYNQKYKNSEFDLFKNQSLMNAIEKLNDLSYCFVCYNNIIDLDDIDNPIDSINQEPDLSTEELFREKYKEKFNEELDKISELNRSGEDARTRSNIEKQRQQINDEYRVGGEDI